MARRSAARPDDGFDEAGPGPDADRHDPKRRDPPWPADREPASETLRALWVSFEDLRIDEASHLTQQIVAERIGSSRTPISTAPEGSEHALLRDAIKDEMARRRRVRKRAANGAATLTPEERKAVALARREESIAHFRGVAQRADTALMAANVRAIRAEDGLARCKATIANIFRDFKAGRWVRAEGGGDVLVDLEAFLTELGSIISSPREEGDSASAPPEPRLLTSGSGRRACAAGAGGKPWRLRR